MDETKFGEIPSGPESNSSPIVKQQADRKDGDEFEGFMNEIKRTSPHVGPAVTSSRTPPEYGPDSIWRATLLPYIDDGEAVLSQPNLPEYPIYAEAANTAEMIFDAIQRGAITREDFRKSQAALIGRVTIAQKEAEKEAEFQRARAERDPLTGLFNREGFNVTIDREIATGRAPFVVAVLDANNLKIRNDTMGYEAGDEYLKKIAAVLDEGRRDEDTISRFSDTYPEAEVKGHARWGGDEYGSILANCNLEGAESWFSRKIGRFQASNISIGCGVVEIDPRTFDGLSDEEKAIQLRDKLDEGNAALKVAKLLSKDNNSVVMIRADDPRAAEKLVEIKSKRNADEEMKNR